VRAVELEFGLTKKLGIRSAIKLARDSVIIKRQKSKSRLPQGRLRDRGSNRF
jgi:hypothetical protein